MRSETARDEPLGAERASAACDGMHNNECVRFHPSGPSEATAHGSQRRTRAILHDLPHRVNHPPEAGA
jgi:hypothetical protein